MFNIYQRPDQLKSYLFAVDFQAYLEVDANNMNEGNKQNERLNVEHDRLQDKDEDEMECK